MFAALPYQETDNCTYFIDTHMFLKCNSLEELTSKLIIAIEKHIKKYEHLDLNNDSLAEYTILIAGVDIPLSCLIRMDTSVKNDYDIIFKLYTIDDFLALEAKDL